MGSPGGAGLSSESLQSSKESSHLLTSWDLVSGGMLWRSEDDSSDTNLLQVFLEGMIKA